MHWLDWLILVLPIVVVVVIAARTRRYVKSVSDFMTGGRVAGRYIVAVSDGIAAMGLITAVGTFEFMYHSGFAVSHWGQIATPIMLVITLTGFVIYRFRETRAMTLAQFFELRYGRRFRLFAGVLTSLAGILNYGIFPAVAGRFFVAYCGLPETITVGGLVLPTFVPVMFVFLSIALVMVLVGGQLTTMVTDCVQGIISYGLYLVVAIAVICLFSWGQMSEALLDRPAGQSMLNPFDTFELTDFNIWYIMIGVFGGVYTLMAWQGNSGYNCAAESPHEAKMGKMLGTWRAGAMSVMFMLLAIAAYTYLNHPDFAAEAAPLHAQLDAMDNDALAGQVRVPMAIARFLPMGVTGAFLAIMILLMISTDTTYLHSWGSILVQDVVMPMRGQPMSPTQHLKALRWSIVGVTVFAFLFSWRYHQTTQIFMFFALTGSIYLGGAGSVIIGGLYWKKATNAGAWASMITGSVVAATGFFLEHFWDNVIGVLQNLGMANAWMIAHQADFPINGQWMWMIAMLSAIVVFVVVSWMTCREDFDMDRMLHRGQYARDVTGKNLPALDLEKPPRTWRALVGVDASFTRGDKWLAGFVVAWSMFFFGLWAVVTIWNVISPWPNEWWAWYFWYQGIVFALMVGAITSVWFSWGGTRDLLRMFAKLKTLKRHSADDGWVIGHTNADDIVDDLAQVQRLEQDTHSP